MVDVACEVSHKACVPSYVQVSFLHQSILYLCVPTEFVSPVFMVSRTGMCSVKALRTGLFFSLLRQQQQQHCVPLIVRTSSLRAPRGGDKSARHPCSFYRSTVR